MIDLKKNQLLIFLIFLYNLTFSQKDNKIQSDCSCKYENNENIPKFANDLEALVEYNELLSISSFDFALGKKDFDKIFLKNIYPQTFKAYTYGQPIIVKHKTSGFELNLTPCSTNQKYIELDVNYHIIKWFDEDFIEDFDHTALSYLEAYLEIDKKEYYEILGAFNEDYITNEKMREIIKHLSDEDISIEEFIVDTYIRDKNNLGKVTEKEKQKITEFLLNIGSGWTFSDLKEQILETKYNIALVPKAISFSVDNDFLKPSKSKKNVVNNIFFKNPGKITIDNYDNFVSTKNTAVCMENAEIVDTGIIFNISSAMLIGGDVTKTKTLKNEFKEMINDFKSILKIDLKSFNQVAGLYSNRLEFLKIPFGKKNVKLNNSSIYINNNMIIGSGYINIDSTDSNEFNISLSNNGKRLFTIESLKKHLLSLGLDNVIVNKRSELLEIKFVKKNKRL